MRLILNLKWNPLFPNLPTCHHALISTPLQLVVSIISAELRHGRPRAAVRALQGKFGSPCLGYTLDEEMRTTYQNLISEYTRRYLLKQFSIRIQVEWVCYLRICEHHHSQGPSRKEHRSELHQKWLHVSHPSYWYLFQPIGLFPSFQAAQGRDAPAATTSSTSNRTRPWLSTAP